ncbi:hypothetical protein Pcinc_025628 [Petrolisthes cinctipes]|uniref:Uncharacterized protein n=2 Tax=Petrolisthes cinctipes TaxID=88211 RepID=A0AAE1KBM0_PETCI|nr:hypothetical protein Pcinc_025628 [Petrolisthes cinctipes]
MACLRREVGVSRVVVQCGGVAGVLEGCLGPHGRAVLMEKAGCIIITQDGSELLSTLDIGDPLLNKVVQAVLEQTKVLGDGCKITILLLRHLLASLDKYLPHSFTMQVSRRQKLIQITKSIRKNVLWRLQRDVINYGAQVYPLRSFEAITHILHSTAEDLFRTKFSKFIAKNLTKLFSSYISSECSSSGELLKLLDHLAVHTHSAIIEVFHMPLVRSHVVSGFIITRRFRHLNKAMKFDNVTFILWSIELEPKKEEEDGQTKDIIETRSGETLVESLVSSRNCLQRCLIQLASLKTQVILSCLCFPDWGMSMCIKYGISLIDGIDREEWTLLEDRLKLQPVVSEEDVLPRSVGTLEKIEPLRIGTCDYIRLGGSQGGHQMVLCGPTVTQCRQFSSAYVQLFKYLSVWIADCLDFYHNNSVGPESETTDCEEEEYNPHIHSKLYKHEHSPDIEYKPQHTEFQNNLDYEYAQHSGFNNGNTLYSPREENITLTSYQEGLPDGHSTRGLITDYEYSKHMREVHHGYQYMGQTEDNLHHHNSTLHENFAARVQNYPKHTRNFQTHIVNSYSGPQDTHGYRYGEYPGGYTLMPSSSSEPCDPRLGAVMYAVPHGGFVELLAKYLVTENTSTAGITDDTTRAILLSLFNEVPWQLHRKVSYSQKSYLEFQTKLFSHFGELRRGGHKFIQPQVTQGSHFTGYQSPFLIFKVLEGVFNFAEYILRIECIIPSKLRISKFIHRSKDKYDSDSDDDDD